MCPRDAIAEPDPCVRCVPNMATAADLRVIVGHHQMRAVRVGLARRLRVDPGQLDRRLIANR